MLFKPAAFIISSLAILTAANPIVARTGGGAACNANTGEAVCCNSVQKASSGPATKILGLLGIVLQDLNVDVGLTCLPISVIGAGGVDCSQTAVCCQNNTYNGLIVIGCSPIIF